MKYPSMKKTKVFSKEIDFSGGINANVQPRNIFDNQLSDSLNIISNNGIARVRKGLTPINTAIIRTKSEEEIISKGFTVTETEYLKNDILNKIAYCVMSKPQSEDIYVYLTSPLGDIAKLGTIRLDSEEGNLYSFDNIFFTVGKKTCGSGIYAFVKRKCFYDFYMHYLYEIYEYNFDTHLFSKLEDTDYYTPVIYINGRGSSFEEAAKTDSVFLGAPTSPEAVNILGGRFTAYFSSDGISSSFKLPVSGLDFNKPIICRVYDSSSLCTEWYIPPKQGRVTTEFLGLDITLSVDKTSGVFSFYNGSYSYSIPKTRMLNGNNICFIGVKEIEKYEERIIGSKDSKLFNSEYYIYGNDYAKNEVYASNFEKPLYFPETTKTSIGNTSSKVICLKDFESNLLAFKAEGIFKINSVNQSGKISYIPPIDSTVEFSNPPRLSCLALTLELGLDTKNTLSFCGNRLVWVKDKKVYCYNKSNQIFELSKPINNLLSNISDGDFSNAFSVAFDGLYYLFLKNKIFVLNFENRNFGITENLTANKENNKNISWYYLELPENSDYIGAYTGEKELFIISKSKDEEITFLSTFSGTTDRIILNPLDPSEDTFIIPFYLKSKNFDLGTSEYKNIISLNLQMSGESQVKIDVEGDGYNSKQEIMLKNNNLSDIKVFPFFMPIKTMNFTIHGNGYFTIDKANIEYNIP